MKIITKYTKNITNAEKKALAIIKNNKKIIILQNNAEILFCYKKKLCKEKICKIIIKTKLNN
ncbi:MAG TPA: hypothetical protein ACYCDA_00405 [Candidatus Azoamicus sp.]